MWAPSPLFLHLGSASPPLQIPSLTLRICGFSGESAASTLLPPSLVLCHCRVLWIEGKPDVLGGHCVHRSFEWGGNEVRGRVIGICIGRVMITVETNLSLIQFVKKMKCTLSLSGIS